MDNELIKRAKSGDKDAFASLYTAYKDKLYRYAYFKLNDPDDAMDAVSSCITEAYLGIASLKSEKAFSTWIFKILYRCCCAYVRDQIEQNSRSDMEVLERVPVEDERLMSVEVREALGQLDTADRDIVLLSAVAGYNSREIAALTGLKAATVRSRLSRSLAKMRAFLE